MTELTLPALTGLAMGLHCATWGVFKDAPYEGFSWWTYVRSPILGVVIAVSLALFSGFDFTGAAGVSVLFGITYGLERAISETYKTFFREQDQSKYTIPMQLAVFGRPVKSRGMRMLMGVLYLGIGISVLLGAYWLQHSGPKIPELLAVFLVSSAGGWISAFGGAWKDAPIEGFHTFKFFRSPAISFSFGLFMWSLTPEYALIFVGSIGYTVATIETYKTFFFPNKDRGKFQGKTPLFPDFLRTRIRFVPLYVLICVGIVGSGVMAVMGARGS
jgi:hypothetical protein